MTSTMHEPRAARSNAVNRSQVDAVRLAATLRRRIKGEVRFSAGDRALYAADASNYRQLPIGVVLPRNASDIILTVATAREFGAPVLMRGGGTSLAGQTCNVAVVIDASKYFNRVLEIDPEHKRARIEPGIVLDELRKATRQFGLTYGPDPATHSRCTLGGMLGNNSCGVHSVMAEFFGPGPMTVDQVEELEILTYDGARFTVGPTSDEQYEQIIRTGGRKAEIYKALRDLRDRYADEIRKRFHRNLIRRASGFNLNYLLPECGFNVARALVGTEGTCVSILSATVTLMHGRECRSLLALGYPDLLTAARDVEWIRELRPIAIEGMDHELVEQMISAGIHPGDVKLLPDGHAWLLVEFGAESDEEAQSLVDAAAEKIRAQKNAPSLKVFKSQAEAKKIWEVREAGLGATAFIKGKPDAWPGWEDSAVPIAQFPEYLKDLRELMSRHGYDASLYGHFGQGLVHCRINFDLETEPGLENYRAFMREAAELATQKHGGTLSGEHGDGQARGEFLPIMYGETIVRAFREFHDIWDPQDGMNPNKSIAGYTCTENLRLGPHYDPPQPDTEFAYPADHGFPHATVRCVGVGLCRRHEGGTMCPSYMVTREEKHSTRGRTHLLFEMLQGQALTKGWRSKAVKSSLDLCLSCKGCKGDCPVKVDVATYKAEFLSHYYRRRLRPRFAYAFGLIHWWAEAAMHMPRVVNFVTHTPGLAGIAKRVVGMSPKRTVPRFANRRFTDWYRSQHPDESGHRDAQRRVILWPDTFNDFFYPQTLAAAAEMIEATGWTVVLPETGLCCGRPLYDYGMLDQARRQLRSIIDSLREEIAAGTPVVGIEPSCVAVFRDELTQMLPRDENAKRLSSQVFTFGEFMNARMCDGFSVPTLEGRKALVHGHCHHKAVMKMDGENAVLAAMKLDTDYPEDGCCGMAGAFGFEAGKYDVSIAVGERVLLPRVRDAADATLVIANGFSCRQQIEQTTNRRALHLAEVMQLARHAAEVHLDGQRPELAARRVIPAGIT